MIIVKGLFSLIMFFSLNSLLAQDTTITDLDDFSQLKIGEENYIYTGFKSWYRSDCLYDQEVTCRNVTNGGVRLLIKSRDNYIEEKLLIGNRAGYQRPGFDSLIYKIPHKDLNNALLTRKLYDENLYTEESPFVIDTLNLKLIDSIVFKKKKYIRRIFKKSYRDSLRIYVFSSSGKPNDSKLHFWVQGIGIIKVVDQNCWNCSFELNYEDRLTQRKNKLFSKLLIAIKEKYKDPSWII
ncbi:hypothetical protein [uncultured Winogradskyella sp.]|uniref:hypothetical protein n=1 Tax=uncultured Winogradskyella sp. TaxID=395353 RepID=UPI002621145A|nr:hypothetical protein [uncultured Winogradskyella sp.]